MSATFPSRARAKSSRIFFANSPSTLGGAVLSIPSISVCSALCKYLFQHSFTKKVQNRKEHKSYVIKYVKNLVPVVPVLTFLSFRAYTSVIPITHFCHSERSEGISYVKCSPSFRACPGIPLVSKNSLFRHRFHRVSRFMGVVRGRCLPSQRAGLRRMGIPGAQGCCGRVICAYRPCLHKFP